MSAPGLITRIFSASISTLIVLCTSCWYLSSNKNAIASQVLFSKFDKEANDEEIRTALLAQLLTASQLILGVLFSLAFFVCRGYCCTTGGSSTDEIRTMLNGISGYDLFIGALHYVGSMCTNMGFAYGSASLVQCVKLLEPIETLVLMVIAIIVRDKVQARSGGDTKRELRQILSVRKVASTSIIIGGTMMLLTQKSMDANPKSIVFALISGVCMASRNVLKKTAASTAGSSAETTKTKSATKSSGEAFVSGIQSFAFITTMAAIPAAAVTIACYVYNSTTVTSVISSLHDIEADAMPSWRKAVLFHCLYNVFSITVLSLTSATTHSLLNVGKRIVNVLAAAAYFGVSLSVSGKCGIGLAAVGAFLYNDNSVERIKNSHLGKYFTELREDCSSLEVRNNWRCRVTVSIYCSFLLFFVYATWS